MNGQRLKPLGMGDIFDEGFDLYKRNFVFLLLVTAVAVVPLDILLASVGPHLMHQAYDLFDMTPGQSDGFEIWLIGAGVRTTLFLPLYALFLGPLVTAASACYLQQENDLWGSMRPSLRRLPGLAFALLLGALFLALGLGFCLIGWPIAGTLLIFTPQAFLVERLGPGKALLRSYALVNGFGGRVFTCLLMLVVILWVISLGVRLPLAYAFEAALNIGPGMGSLYGGGAAGLTAGQHVVTLLSSGLTHLLLFPFLVCILTTLYYDMRIRREGYDIEMLAQELGYPPLPALGGYLPPAPVLPLIRPTPMAPPQLRGRRGPR